MGKEKTLYLGEISIFKDHEDQEHALKEPHRRQVLAGFKSKNFTVHKQHAVRRRARHFKYFRTPHLERKVRHIYPRGKVFHRVALLSCDI
jgi:hypothetical protein